MGKKPNFAKLLSLFEANEDFSITEKQYLKSTGVSMPKGTYYLKNNSAFSRLAKKYGYAIEINERTISLKKQCRKFEGDYKNEKSVNNSINIISMLRFLCLHYKFRRQ